ncbi:MAG: response regulator [Methanomicrobiaceae archaeon]|nr:response regulator [Methanomicrobiaceae archaeon]
MKSVLVVDDEPVVLKLFEGLIEKNNHNIKLECCTSPYDAIKKVSEYDFDAIISDYNMPEMTGTELLRKIRDSGNEIPFILLSGLCQDKVAADAINEGVDYILLKNHNFPEQINRLEEIISTAAKNKPGKNDDSFHEAKYRSLIESMDDSIYMVDDECRYLFMNKKHLERIGKTSEIYRGRRYQDFHTPEEAEKFSKIVDRIFSNGEEIEEIYEKDNKKYIRIFSPVRSINDEKIIASNVISKEIRKPGSEIVEDSIYIVDEDCRYLSINSEHMQRLGINCEDTYIGRSYDEFHPKGKNDTFARIIKQVFETGELVKDEYLYGNFHFTRRFCPVKDISTGEVIAVTVVSTNVTDQKITEKSLIEANKKINLLNSITRHDILNQMTVLNGYLELSLNISENDEQKVFLEKQKAAADTIYHQICFTRDYQDVGVSAPGWQSVTDLVKTAEKSLDMKGIKIVNRCRNLKIFADPLLEKVFYNLIENSVRHGEKISEISLYYEKIPHGIRLIYEDNGVGIKDEEKNIIFRQGYGKNTGLGLFLIREILSITGLEIHETGIYGKGAKFGIDIPEKVYSE